MTVAQMHQKLDEIIRCAAPGEPVVVEAGGHRLSVDSSTPNVTRLGLLEHLNLDIPDSFWEPMAEEELKLWEGTNE